MYGLILENLSQYVSSVYGEHKWEEVRRLARVEQTTFSTHQVYPDNTIQKLVNKACKILGIQEKVFLEGMGVYFVKFLKQYGYDRVLSVLGRHMRDFLNGLDNLHEYLKFSYPRLKAPSFFCENETPTGLTLHYRSSRRGFLWYTIGQIKEVGRHFYRTTVVVEVVAEETNFDVLHVTMMLTFDNQAFRQQQRQQVQLVDRLMTPVQPNLFLEIFPFCMVFDQTLTVRTIGVTLQTIMSPIIGKKITDVFDLVRPIIEYTWQSIHDHTNNIFELTSVDPIKEPRGARGPGTPLSFLSTYSDGEEIGIEERLLHLKGQMLYVEDWKCIVYLGTPMMRDLDSMLHTGLYINDLSMHDFSRDMVLAGQQQSAELKLALDLEQQKSKQLEESMKKLDVEMKRTDELLYQMIPKQVADLLRRGTSAVETCKYFDSVTILFSDVVTFTEICSRISPMEVVSMLNSMYSLFDQLTEKHGVYKVETIGDAYMVVCGAPTHDPHHAEKVCNMALDMVVVIGDLKDPSTGQSLRIRVGIHSGAVVAGIVGLKMPRYCLFGDAVNTASRMESTSEALGIQISQYTKDRLNIEMYELSERGVVSVKGKGMMSTYWLLGRHKDYQLPEVSQPVQDLETTEELAESPPQDGEVVDYYKNEGGSTKPDEEDERDLLESRALYSPITLDELPRSTSPPQTPFSCATPSELERRISMVPRRKTAWQEVPSQLNGDLKKSTPCANCQKKLLEQQTTSVPLGCCVGGSQEQKATCQLI